MRKLKKLKEAKAGGVLLLTVWLYLKRLPYKKKDSKYYSRLDNLHKQVCCFKILHNIEKKYRKKCDQLKYKILDEDMSLPHEHNKIIWILWLQGIENAPAIVRMCYQSILNNFSDEYKIILLNENNLGEYISLPDFIISKYKKGYISNQTYADLIRLGLLEKYGGTWMDATIFCSNKHVPEHMMNSDLFIFQTMFPATWGIPTVMNSYFITACQNNKIIRLAKELFYDYWKNNTYNSDYWLINDFFELAKDTFSEDWQKVLPEEPLSMHILQDRMKQKFDKEIFDFVISKTPFHKLQWRYADDNFDTTGTYYEYLLKHYPIYGEEINREESTNVKE